MLWTTDIIGEARKQRHFAKDVRSQSGPTNQAPMMSNPRPVNGPRRCGSPETFLSCPTVTLHPQMSGLLTYITSGHH